MKRVLIVEDNLDLLEFLTEYLSAEGFDPVPLQDSSNVLAIVNSAPPDAILMDVMLQPVQGDAVVRQIKQSYQFRSTPVILMSSLDDLPQLASAAQADYYLRKPFDLDELATVLHSATQ